MGGWWGGGGGGPCPLGAARPREGCGSRTPDAQGSLKPGWGPAPGGCHGDAGSAAPRRNSCPPAPRPSSSSAGASSSRGAAAAAAAAHTPAAAAARGQVRRARPPPGVGGWRLGPGAGGGDGGVQSRRGERVSGKGAPPPDTVSPPGRPAILDGAPGRGGGQLRGRRA